MAVAQLTADEANEVRRRELARRYYLAFVKLTFPDYKVDPVHKYVATKLQEFVEAVERGEGPRLIIQLPPQHGKSELSTRRLIPWIMGRNPNWSVILASYGAEWAEALSGDALRIVMDEMYAEIFGQAAAVNPEEAVEIERNRKSVTNWRIARHRGGVSAVGADGAVTGRPANVLILDDPVKGRKQADSKTERDALWGQWPQFRDRVQMGGGILAVGTPWHYDDYLHRLQKLRHPDTGKPVFEVLSLAAIAEKGDLLGRPVGASLAPSLHDESDLRGIKADVGSRDWLAKYMLRPTEKEGDIFKYDWLQRGKLQNFKPLVTYQFWDLAFGKDKDSDYSVCATIGVEEGPRFCLLDIWRAQTSFPEVVRAIRNMAASTQYGSYGFPRPRMIWVERKGREHDFYEKLRNEVDMPNLAWYLPDRDKVQRAHSVTPIMEAGNFWVPEDAPWLADYWDELSKFDKGDHDDQVDVTTMGLIILSVRNIRMKKAHTGARAFRFAAA